ncbi:MAG: hypothetical protein IPM18_11370 [Phycisphaerales bacterium]|nr:hypothetical protein [Phycisphaerales bacterium]
MRIAIDIDGTITRAPEFFGFLAAALRAAGHRVYIMSFRTDVDETRSELAEWGIPYDELHVATARLIHEHGYYRWKGALCKQFEIDVLFDDMPEVLRHVDSRTIAMMPVDGSLGCVTYQEPGLPA